MKYSSDHIKLPQVIPALMSTSEQHYLDELLQTQEQLGSSEGSFM